MTSRLSIEPGRHRWRPRATGPVRPTTGVRKSYHAVVRRIASWVLRSAAELVLLVSVNVLLRADDMRRSATEILIHPRRGVDLVRAVTAGASLVAALTIPMRRNLP